MGDILVPGVIAATFVLSCWLTARVRQYAIARHLVDVPNERSSHVAATPRAGGIAIAVPTMLALLGLALAGRVDLDTAVSLCAGGVVAAVIGFMDDRTHVSPAWRLIWHFVAAVLVLSLLHERAQLAVMGVTLGSNWLGFLVLSLYLVWMLNLTNFMDGIDGITGVEVVTVCVTASCLGRIAAPAAQLWVAPLILASATLGFLVWNWPPAKIFMGDVGSGFLGLTMGALSLQAALAAPRLFWAWAILLGVFVVDATVTLIQRMARRDRLYEAHRTHAYQHAAIRHRSHLRVSVAVGVVNIFWLAPIAFVVGIGRLDGPWGVVVAYVPLIVAAMRLNAGRPAKV